MFKVTEEILCNVLRVHAPIKAIRICRMISKEYGEINKREINSMLYGMSAKGRACKNDKYEWSLGAIPKGIARAENTHKETVVRDAAIDNGKKIDFSGEQEKAINIELDGNLLIRGQAGSGKTTVLAARAGKNLSVISKGSVLFLTYNTALCRYVDCAFKSAGSKNGLKVTTFHNWAKATADKLGYDSVSWVDQKERTDQLKTIIQEVLKDHVNHRLYDVKNPDIISWWNDEFAWIFGQGIFDFADYTNAERVGRGTAIRLSADDRHYIWLIFEKYMGWLNENGKEDYDNVAGLVNKAIKKNGGSVPESMRYDHVFVDEVQDFDKSWLSVLSEVPRVSLSMAGDIAQRIYKRSFSWKSAGISIQAHRSRALKGSYRTTKQIMEVASKVMEESMVHLEDDYVSPIMPIRNGPKIVKIVRATTKTAYNDGYRYVAAKFKRIRKATVAIALPFQRQLYPAQKQLNELGLKVEKAKGAALGKFSSGVVVTNYHQLKGLEFDHVVIFGLDDQTFPGRYLDRVFSEDLSEEERVLRKLLYVVMTRAKQSLTLVGGQSFCRFFNKTEDQYFELK
ncbi:MAG: UvrD-helicase domain-containing protein [Nitrospinales bacterium]